MENWLLKKQGGQTEEHIIKGRTLVTVFGTERDLLMIDGCTEKQARLNYQIDCPVASLRQNR